MPRLSFSGRQLVSTQVRKAIRNKGHFPSDEAATKLIYLALRNIMAKWKRPPKNWLTHRISYNPFVSTV
jgi:transposase-like protein